MPIKPKQGKCIDCKDGKQVPVIAGRCRTCYWRYRHKVNEIKHDSKRSHINPKSAKQLERDIEYAKLRKEWLKSHPTCQAKLSGCQHSANQIHHMQGRLGDLLLDTSKWLAICHRCHVFITENSDFAIKKGLSLRRNSAS